jgi:hypothetical protein
MDSKISKTVAYTELKWLGVQQAFPSKPLGSPTSHFFPAMLSA